MKKTISLLLVAFSSLLFSQKKWSLRECVDYAMKNNLQVIGGQYGNDIQKKNLEIAKKDRLPSVSGTFSNSANFGQGRDIFGNVQRNDNFTNNASVGANIQLYNAGRIKKNVEKYQYDLQANLYDLEKTKNDISLQIAQQYLQILLNKEISKISESAVENAQKLLNRASITTDVGTTPKTIEAEARANLAREKLRLQSAKIDVQRSLFNLALLLQLKDFQNFDVEDFPSPNTLETPLSSTENIVDKAYENQPQLKAAQERIKSAEKQTEIAKTGYFPTVTANAGIGTSYFDGLNYRNNNFIKQYKDNFGQQIGVSANIPIFNKGITKLQVEQAKINESVAKNSLEISKQEILQNVQKAYFDANANYENFLAAVEAEKSTKLALDFAEKSFEAGRTTIYDLNIARNNYANAQGSVAQSKYNYLFSLKLLNFYAGIPLNL